MLTVKEKLLFTTQETSKITGLSPSLIKKLARQQQLNIVRIGRLVRVPRHELLRLCGATDQTEFKS